MVLFRIILKIKINSRHMSSNNTIVQESKVMKPLEMEGDSDTVPESNTVKEGRALLRLVSNHVFYNPVQEFNRDLSIAVLNVFTNDYKKEKLLRMKKQRENNRSNQNLDDMENNKVDITILEALSATGLRSIRYAQEVMNVTKVIANDISEKSVETIKDNIEYNNVEHLVETSHGDAREIMYMHKNKGERFAAIDLDPYGCPSTFLDAAVQSVDEGGLLLITATDMAVLAGNCPETCYNKYGSICLKTKSCHEMALRILLYSIEQHANRYSRYIVPLLSISVDFYIRVYVKVYSGAIHCKNSISKMSMVYRCVGCDSVALQPLGELRPRPTAARPQLLAVHLPAAPVVAQACDVCNQRYQMGGPIWTGALHDESFVSRTLCRVQEAGEWYGTLRRMLGVLAVVTEELPDAPLYYTLDRLCSAVHAGTMPMLTLRSAILNAGYRVSYSHAHRLSVKTNAPRRLVWDVMRAWASVQPTSSARIEKDPVAKYILSQPITYEVDLVERCDANPASRLLGQRRFQANPAPFWGPGVKSTFNDANKKMIKSRTNQFKNTPKKKNRRQKKKRLLSEEENEEEACKRSSNRLVLAAGSCDSLTDESSQNSAHVAGAATGALRADVGDDAAPDATEQCNSGAVDIDKQ